MDEDGTKVDLATPKLEVIRDVYQTMNRRLEHYRQLVTAAIFGTVAIFVLATASIGRWKSNVSVPKTTIETIEAIAEPIMTYIVVIVVVVFAIQLVRRVERNFSEVSQIILKVEWLMRVHDKSVFIPTIALFPGHWPNFNYQTKQVQPKWQEDVIPVSRKMIGALAILFTVYTFSMIADAIYTGSGILEFLFPK